MRSFSLIPSSSPSSSFTPGVKNKQVRPPPRRRLQRSMAEGARPTCTHKSPRRPCSWMGKGWTGEFSLPPHHSSRSSMNLSPNSSDRPVIHVMRSESRKLGSINRKSVTKSRSSGVCCITDAARPRLISPRPSPSPNRPTLTADATRTRPHDFNVRWMAREYSPNLDKIVGYGWTCRSSRCLRVLTAHQT